MRIDGVPLAGAGMGCATGIAWNAGAGKPRGDAECIIGTADGEKRMAGARVIGIAAGRLNPAVPSMPGPTAGGPTNSEIRAAPGVAYARPAMPCRGANPADGNMAARLAKPAGVGWPAAAMPGCRVPHECHPSRSW